MRYLLYVSCSHNISNTYYQVIIYLASQCNFLHKLTKLLHKSQNVYQFFCMHHHCTFKNFLLKKNCYTNLDTKLFLIIFSCQYDGKPIKWTHLLHLQEWDRGTERNAPGLLLVPKLSFEHLHLTPGLRMRVSLAAQVQ